MFMSDQKRIFCVRVWWSQIPQSLWRIPQLAFSPVSAGTSEVADGGSLAGRLGVLLFRSRGLAFSELHDFVWLLS